MRLQHWIIWAVTWLLAGLLLADVLPGAEGFATGPKWGIAMALATLGALVLGVPLTTWYLRKTTKATDYEGACPVGRVCPQCGAFNLNPRTVCRVCATSLDAQAEVEAQPGTATS